MSDYIPEYITNPDYGWAYCPHCDYPPSFRPHHLAKIDGERRSVHACECGAVRATLKGFQVFTRDKEPWYIQRKWRRQKQGRRCVYEYLQGTYLGRYPISQHVREVLDAMPLDWKARLSFDPSTAITEQEAGQ